MKKGFSLPLWVAGAARSALKKLVGLPFENYESITIPNEKKQIKIEIHSVGLFNDDSHALGITFAKSGLDLDITQNLEIWTIASLEKISFKNPVPKNPINIIAGYGVGIKEDTSEICISDFAKEVLYENLLDSIPEGFNLKLEIIFPNGKFLAEKLFQILSNTIEERSFEYVNRYVKTDMEIAAIIFDRKRKIRWSGTNGKKYISYFQ